MAVCFVYGNTIYWYGESQQLTDIFFIHIFLWVLTRPGKPKKFLSDKSLNLTAGENEIRKAREKLALAIMKSYAFGQNTKWRFIVSVVRPIWVEHIIGENGWLGAECHGVSFTGRVSTVGWSFVDCAVRDSVW